MFSLSKIKAPLSLIEVLLFFFIISEGACQRAAVLCDHHSGAERFMSAGSHLGEDAWLGKWIHLSVTF